LYRGIILFRFSVKVLAVLVPSTKPIPFSPFPSFSAISPYITTIMLLHLSLPVTPTHTCLFSIPLENIPHRIHDAKNFLLRDLSNLLHDLIESIQYIRKISLQVNASISTLFSRVGKTLLSYKDNHELQQLYAVTTGESERQQFNE
jgi:hypothetical protein